MEYILTVFGYLVIGYILYVIFRYVSDKSIVEAFILLLLFWPLVVVTTFFFLLGEKLMEGADKIAVYIKRKRGQ